PSDDRVLRSRRLPQAELVRRLPPVAGLSDAHRLVPERQTRSRPLRVRDDRARRGRGSFPSYGAGRGSPLGCNDLPIAPKDSSSSELGPRGADGGRLSGRRLSSRVWDLLGLRVRDRGCRTGTSSQLDVRNQPCRDEGDEADRSRDYEHRLNGLCVGGNETVMQSWWQLVQNRWRDARGVQPVRQLGTVQVPRQIAHEHVGEDASEDRSPERAADRAEERGARSGDPEL